MVRTQIQLTEKQARELKRMAINQGVSMAELIRQSVDQFIQQKSEPDREKLLKRIAELSGKYSTGITDLAENHDAYLDEIYGESSE